MNSVLEKKVIVTLGLALWLYLFLRAYFVPFVHDEGSFFPLIQTGKFMPGSNEWNANNHFLNSALSWCFYKLFGSGELALRLANLVFFPLFFVFWYKLSGLLSDRLIRLIFLLSGLFAHAMLEFFALSRGYGMSMALLITCLWYFIRAFKESRGIFLITGVVFLLVAIYANLSLLNNAILIMALLTYYWVINSSRIGNRNSSGFGNRINSRTVFFAILTGLSGIVFFAFLLVNMRKNGTLYYGSGDGFWNVTAKSLILLFLGTGSLIVKVVVLILTLFFLVGLICLFVPNQDRVAPKDEKIKLIFTPAFIFPFLFFGNMAAVIMLNKLLSINYPEDRVGMYFFIYFIGSVCFVTDALVQNSGKSLLQFVAIPLLYLPVHFILHMNLSYTTLWKDENIPHRFYDELEALAIKSEDPPSIGGYRMRKVSWAYQNFRHGGFLSQIYSNHYPETESDYQLVVAPAFSIWEKQYERIDYDPASKLSLLKRKKFLSKKLLVSVTGISTKQESTNEFFELFRGQLDTLTGKSLYVQTAFKLNSLQKPFTAWIVVEIDDRQNKQIEYENIPLDWLRPSWTDATGSINGIQLFPVPAGSKTLICYIWNKDKELFSLTEGRFNLFRRL